MMTEHQLEIAAREYCRLAGIDAEKKVNTSPPLNNDGTINMVCIWVPAWKPVAEMIAQQDLARHCIDLASSKNNTQSGHASALSASTGSASVALDAYRDLMTAPIPSCEKDFHRAIMLAVLIGRQIESDYRDQFSPNVERTHRQ